MKKMLKSWLFWKIVGAVLSATTLVLAYFAENLALCAFGGFLCGLYLEKFVAIMHKYS